jgi:hypothetical protein
MGDPASPSGRPDMGGSGSPTPSTTRPGDADCGAPNGGVAREGAAEAILSDVDRTGIGKSGEAGSPTAAGTGGVGAIALFAGPSGGGCAGKPAATRWRAIDASGR